jgi:hypothetical protein
MTRGPVLCRSSCRLGTIAPGAGHGTVTTMAPDPPDGRQESGLPFEAGDATGTASLDGCQLRAVAAVEPLARLHAFGVDITEALALPLPMRSAHGGLHLSGDCPAAPMGGVWSWNTGRSLASAAEQLCLECLPDAVTLSPLAEWLYHAGPLLMGPATALLALDVQHTSIAKHRREATEEGFDHLATQLGEFAGSVEAALRGRAQGPLDDELAGLAFAEAARLVAVDELTGEGGPPGGACRGWLQGPEVMSAWAQLASMWPAGDRTEALVHGPIGEVAVERFGPSPRRFADLAAAAAALDERARTRVHAARDRQFLVVADQHGPAAVNAIWVALRVRAGVFDQSAAVIVDGLAGPGLARRLGGIALEVPAELPERVQRLLPATFVSLRTGALLDPVAALEAALAALD